MPTLSAVVAPDARTRSRSVSRRRSILVLPWGSGPLQRVKLHFHPEAARYVREKVWHPSQALEEQPDASLVLTIAVNHLLEVKRWVLSYGAACRVLEPPELRREVVEEIRRMATAYDTTPGIT